MWERRCVQVALGAGKRTVRQGETDRREGVEIQRETQRDDQVEVLVVWGWGR